MQAVLLIFFVISVVLCYLLLLLFQYHSWRSWHFCLFCHFTYALYCLFHQPTTSSYHLGGRSVGLHIIYVTVDNEFMNEHSHAQVLFYYFAAVERTEERQKCFFFIHLSSLLAELVATDRQTESKVSWLVFALFVVRRMKWRLKLLPAACLWTSAMHCFAFIGAFPCNRWRAFAQARILLHLSPYIRVCICTCMCAKCIFSSSQSQSDTQVKRFKLCDTLYWLQWMTFAWDSRLFNNCCSLFFF